MLFQTIANVFRIPELRSKILFTLGMLAVYRIGFWIPVPGVDQSALSQYFETQVNSGSAAGRLAQYVSIFSGGSFGQSTIFGLGIMPYITASIIFQLFGTVSPKLKALQRGRPQRQPEDRRVDPLRHRRTLHRPGSRLDEVHHHPELGLPAVADQPGLVDHGCCHPHRRHRLPHVARRADRQARHRQRRLPDHHGRHPHRHAQRHHFRLQQLRARRPLQNGLDGPHAPHRRLRHCCRRLGPAHRRPAPHPGPAGQAHSRGRQTSSAASAVTCPSRSTTAA
jgi:hypothetical protein